MPRMRTPSREGVIGHARGILSSESIIAAMAATHARLPQPHARDQWHGAVPSAARRVLTSSGQHLDPTARAAMESQFGHDFSRVRVHSDGEAAIAARSVDALAYTVGQHMVFGRNQYQPSSAAGRELIAHELTHVVQQTMSGTVALQRQPQPPGQATALDPDEQKIVDAAKRESAKFRCNVGPVLWGILRKYFPNDIRKINGTGCESIPGLRTEFSETDPKDPKLVRNVPILYAGKAFIDSTDAAQLKQRVADVAAQIALIDDWRLKTYRIDGQDLKDPKVTGQLRGLDNSQLVDYKDKTKDSDVKQYVENLAKFATPTQPGATIDPFTGEMGLSVGGVTVVIEQDLWGQSGLKGAETGANLTLSPAGIPGFNTDAKGIVKDFPGYTPSATLKIRTRYGAGTKPEFKQGYGRGTIPQDIANKATSIRFHEGTHGEDAIDYLRTHPLPVFTGKNGDHVKDFRAARQRYLDALAAWNKGLNDRRITAECVGKSIDEFHKGEKGYKKICP